MSDEPFLQDIGGDPILWLCIFIIIVCLCLLCACFFIYRRRSGRFTKSQCNNGLNDNAKRLGLQVCEVKNKCMFAAIADQLTLKCPHGNYTVENLQKLVLLSYPKKTTFSVACTLRRRLIPGNTHDDWQADVDKLQRLADALCRVIEIIHDQRRDTTVIRPFDSQVDDSIMTLYIGRCRRGNYYSLRHKTKVSNKCQGTNSSHPYGTPFSQTSDISNDKDGNNDFNTKDVTETNVMIGTNNRQYVINRTKICGVQNNTVNGDGNTQKVLVTVDTSEELRKFLLEENFSGGDKTSIHLKIRQRSENISPEELEIGERKVIEALNDCENKERAELNKILEQFDVSFESAMQGCILLKFICLNHSIRTFIDNFYHLESNIVINFILNNLIIDASSKEINFHLDFDIDKDYKRHRLLRDTKPTAIGETKRESTNSTHVDLTKRYSNGISITCKPKKGKVCSQEQKDKVLTILQKNMLEMLKRSTQGTGYELSNLDCEKYQLELLASNEGTVEMHETDMESHYRYTERLLETMNGSVGIIKTEDGMRGTCFLASTKYIISAGHLFHQCDFDSDFEVQFPGENHLKARLVYLSEEVDFAILEIQGNPTRIKPPMYHFLESASPGLSFYFMLFKSSIDNKPFVEKAVLGANYCQYNQWANVHNHIRYTCLHGLDEMAEWRCSYTLVEALGHHIKPGCSGSPGVLMKGDKLYVILMLIGTWRGNEMPSYVALNMLEILYQLELLNSKLAKRVFSHFIKTNKDCAHCQEY